MAQPGVPGEWRHYGADGANTKHSPLDQITVTNFSDLEVAWRWISISTEVASRREQIRPGLFKATPLMVGGLVYVSTPLGQVAALDAGTGEAVWTYDPHSYDRIDLSVWVPAVPFRTLTKAGHGEVSAFVRRRVAEARRRQIERRRSGDAYLNARLEGRALECHCALDPAGLRMLDAASRRFHLTGRSCHRLMKVARTIADLAGKEQIIAEHLAEAVQFRLER